MGTVVVAVAVARGCDLGEEDLEAVSLRVLEHARESRVRAEDREKLRVVGKRGGRPSPGRHRARRSDV